MSRLAAPLAAGIFRAIRGPWADRFPAGLRPAVVPVPIGPWKYFRRGYNFPALIGEPLSRLAGWPFAPCLLRRTGGSRPQAGLPLSERVRNVRGAFEAGAASAGAVLLVDDVYTSGATAAACARALRSAGVETVLVVTAARALP